MSKTHLSSSLFLRAQFGETTFMSEQREIQQDRLCFMMFALSHGINKTCHSKSPDQGFQVRQPFSQDADSQANRQGSSSNSMRFVAFNPIRTRASSMGNYQDT